MEGVVDKIKIRGLVVLQSKCTLKGLANFKWKVDFGHSRIDEHGDAVTLGGIQVAQEVNVFLVGSACAEANQTHDQVSVVVWGQDEGEIIGNYARGIVAAKSKTAEYGLIA